MYFETLLLARPGSEESPTTAMVFASLRIFFMTSGLENDMEFTPSKIGFRQIGMLLFHLSIGCQFFELMRDVPCNTGEPVVIGFEVIDLYEADAASRRG